MNNHQPTPNPSSTAWRPTGATLIFTLTAIVLAIPTLEPLNQLLQFDRQAILNGQLHRLFTAHLVHFGTSHLFWDALMFAALGFILERNSVRTFLTTLLLSATTISIGILFLEPTFEIYRGLSGVDSALFAALAATTLRNHKGTTKAIALTSLILLLAKCIYEYHTHDTLFANLESGASPIPAAHLIGAATGTLTAALPKSLAGKHRPHPPATQVRTTTASRTQA